MSLIHGKQSATTYPIKVLGGGTMNGVLEVVSTNVYPRQKFEYTNTAQCIYMGFHTNPNAQDTAADWIILKRAYNSDGLPTQHQVLVGAWSTHTTMSWAF